MRRVCDTLLARYPIAVKITLRGRVVVSPAVFAFYRRKNATNSAGRPTFEALEARAAAPPSVTPNDCVGDFRLPIRLNGLNTPRFSERANFVKSRYVRIEYKTPTDRNTVDREST